MIERKPCRKLGERRTTSTTTEANLELLRWADVLAVALRTEAAPAAFDAA